VPSIEGMDATGCRISEALALTARQVDLSGRVVVFESLKTRRSGVNRAVPVPRRSRGFVELPMGHGGQPPGRQTARLPSRASSCHGFKYEND